MKMSDLDKFKKLFDEAGVPQDLQVLSGAEAEELARMCREPGAGKSRKYILVGNTTFHFDHFGRFLGVESTAFEPRERKEGEGDGNEASA
jgi:hypothetical protein